MPHQPISSIPRGSRPIIAGQPISFIPRGTRPPKTNAERQAEFRRRHPDYNRLYKARVRAAAKARAAAREAARTRAAIEALVLPLKPQLLLPAPVELPVIPGLTTIARTTVREAVPARAA